MGTVATDTSKLIGMGAGNISCFANEFSMSGEYAIDDASGMCDTQNQNVMGKQGVATVSASGRYEDGSGSIAVTANTRLESDENEVVIMLPLGIGHGLPAMCEHGLTTMAEVESPADGLTTIGIEGASDVGLDLGFQLGVYSTAITADGQSADLDMDAASTSGGAAYVIVTDLTGLTAVDVTIEDSADGSTGWATIATLPQITADNQAERVEISGAVKRYLRAVYNVTGTGSAKILAGFARYND